MAENPPPPEPMDDAWEAALNQKKVAFDQVMLARMRRDDPSIPPEVRQSAAVYAPLLQDAFASSHGGVRSAYHGPQNTFGSALTVDDVMHVAISTRVPITPEIGDLIDRAEQIGRQLVEYLPKSHERSVMALRNYEVLTHVLGVLTRQRRPTPPTPAETRQALRSITSELKRVEAEFVSRADSALQVEVLPGNAHWRGDRWRRADSV